MEFLKHEMSEFSDAKNETTIRRSAEHYATTNPVFKTEREDITRQRLLFTVIIGDHYEVLFNGTSNERAPLWEEIRLFMIENGAVTLVDKDWKYTASCYWQNIRKESIRRMAKIKMGSMKQARPGQLELDRLVSIVIEKRGPGSLETVVNHYSNSYVERESNGNSNKVLDGEEDDVIIEKPSITLAPLNQSNIQTRKQLRNSISPVYEEQNNQQIVNTQTPKDQKCTSTKISINNVPQHQQASTSTTSYIGQQSILNSGTNNQKLQNINDSSTNENQNSPASFSSSSSQQLGMIVAKTHSQLIGGGHLEMAGEFETQLKQLINGYKAWMFDQLFQQHGETEDESSVGFQQQQQTPGTNSGGGTDVKRPRL